MSITRPSSALESIEKITDQLAAHNSGKKVLTNTERKSLLAQLGRLNKEVERCMTPATRRAPKKPSDEAPSVLALLGTIGGAIVALTFMVVMYALLMQSVAASFVMKP